MTLAALRRTLDPADGDAMGLVEAALSAHSQLTRDVGDSMAAAVLCRRQVWLAQTSLPEAIRTELLNLPVAPGHAFHPESQAVFDRTECAAASREAVQRVCIRTVLTAHQTPRGKPRLQRPSRPSRTAGNFRDQPVQAEYRGPARDHYSRGGQRPSRGKYAGRRGGAA